MLRLQVLIITIAFSSQAMSWGRLGHRITAEVAYKHLNEKAKAEIQKLTPFDTLAHMSNHADFIKSIPEMVKKHNHHHYISFDEEVSVKNYIKKNPKKDHIISALNKYTKILKNKKAKVKERAFALKFIVHLVGDVH